MAQEIEETTTTTLILEIQDETFHPSLVLTESQQHEPKGRNRRYSKFCLQSNPLGSKICP